MDKVTAEQIRESVIKNDIGYLPPLSCSSCGTLECAMDRWEYKEETSHIRLTSKEFIDWLNEEGQNGWEMIEYNAWDMCGWSSYYTCIFKRKIQQDNGNK